MQAFVGIRDAGGICHIYLRSGDDLCEISPDRSQEVYNYSPDGFDWGTSGSGASQLALALLLEVTADDDKALNLHHDFEFQVVARLPNDHWTLAVQKVQEWVINNA